MDRRPSDTAEPVRSDGVERRLTVNLTPRAAKALDQAAAASGDSRTDTVNRALQVYAYLEQVSRNGGSLYVREGGDAGGELTMVRFL
ncbi:hypothetical protein [Kitasatospora sp. NPDC088346]|uniref:hypothetical protein n=1 Tax=Kitasatospora sp. NPDC088346 TaxID=3364073 RepID=UPI00380C7C91